MPDAPYEGRLVLDCANGVGYNTIVQLIPRLSHLLKIELINTKTDYYKLLNEDCGAEHVQK